MRQAWQSNGGYVLTVKAMKTVSANVCVQLAVFLVRFSRTNEFGLESRYDKMCVEKMDPLITHTVH